MFAKSIRTSVGPVGVLVLCVFLTLWQGQALAQKWGGNQVKGSGVAMTETRAVTGFHDVTLGVDAKVELRQGASEGLTISGDDNVVPLIETVVDNGTLKIRWAAKGNYSTSYKDLRIVIDLKNVERLTVSGSGDIHAAQLKAGDLRTTISGSGDVRIDALDAQSLNVTISGSGDMKVAGHVDSLDATLSGSGGVAAAKLESRAARVTLQGSGDASVWAKETLNATVAGSGEIKYYGQPQVHRTVAGSGSVSRARDAS